MPGPRPTAKQRLALHMIRDGQIAAANIPESCRVEGGYRNEAEFLLRLMDRGWVRLALTPEGEQELDA